MKPLQYIHPFLRYRFSPPLKGKLIFRFAEYFPPSASPVSVTMSPACTALTRDCSQRPPNTLVVGSVGSHATRGSWGAARGCAHCSSFGRRCKLPRKDPAVRHHSHSGHHECCHEFGYHHWQARNPKSVFSS